MISRQNGDLAIQAEIMTSLGDLHAAEGQHAEAVRAWRESLELYTRAGDRRAAEVRSRLSAA